MRTPMILRLAALALLGSFAATANAQTIAITGGTVYPASGPKIENGTVLIRDGKIVAVGADIVAARSVLERSGWIAF